MKLVRSGRCGSSSNGSRLLRRQYLAARARGEVEILDLEEDAWNPM
jgi:hypothetical protein